MDIVITKILNGEQMANYFGANYVSKERTKLAAKLIKKVRLILLVLQLAIKTPTFPTRTYP